MTRQELSDREERNPYFMHLKLSEKHGRYDRFNDLMVRYSDRVLHLDSTGAIEVISEFEEDMRKRNLIHFLPLVRLLNNMAKDLTFITGVIDGGGRN